MSIVNLNSTTPTPPAANGVVQFLTDGGSPVRNTIGTLPPFGASGAGHSPGAVPDPGSSAGTTRVLREDSTWVAATGTGNVVLATEPAITIGGNSLKLGTHAGATSFVSQTLNNDCNVALVPNGTSNTSAIRLYNAVDPNNWGDFVLKIIGGTVYCESLAFGTGTIVTTWDITNIPTLKGAAIAATAHISSSANPAAAGALRLASTDSINWRNNANSADVLLAKDSSDRLTFNGSSAQILVYDHTGSQRTFSHIVSDAVTLSGGAATVTLSGSAVFTSSGSYEVVAVDATANNPLSVSQTSGSSFSISGTGTDVIRYIAIGS